MEKKLLEGEKKHSTLFCYVLLKVCSSKTIQKKTTHILHCLWTTSLWRTSVRTNPKGKSCFFPPDGENTFKQELKTGRTLRNKKFGVFTQASRVALKPWRNVAFGCRALRQPARPDSLKEFARVYSVAQIHHTCNRWLSHFLFAPTELRPLKSHEDTGIWFAALHLPDAHNHI